MIYAGKASENGPVVEDTPDKVDDPALVTKDPAGDSEDEDEEAAEFAFFGPFPFPD